ncbi:MAG: hypothetical protein HGA65_15580 [Oscillochloris sp.]|nr:hypothetical protein [Oscillochloris sp.]
MRLLILTCSARKRGGPEPTPVVERYDGPLWQVLRSYLREQPMSAADLTIYGLSAEFGLIPGDQRIPHYDRTMDPDQADALRPLVRETFATLMGQGYDQLCLGFPHLVGGQFGRNRAHRAALPIDHRTPARPFAYRRPSTAQLGDDIQRPPIVQFKGKGLRANAGNQVGLLFAHGRHTGPVAVAATCVRIHSLGRDVPWTETQLIVHSLPPVTSARPSRRSGAIAPFTASINGPPWAGRRSASSSSTSDWRFRSFGLATRNRTPGCCARIGHD